MNCPEKIIVKPTEITEQKCIDNLAFWKSQLADTTEDASVLNHKNNSIKVLAGHTARFDYFKNTFGYDENTNTFNPDCLGILSKQKRNEIDKISGLGVADKHMSTSVKLGHDIFVFSYHGIHNPYHRQSDPPPQQPIGYFIKKDIEVFSCVHGTPSDVAEVNKLVDPYRDEHLDKFYLLPNDLREYKPLQIKNEPYLQNDFWFYFGSPEYWQNTADYGKHLYARQGEFRYLNSIKPDDIEAILWPIWSSSISTPMDKNWDLISEFKKTFSSIKVIEYDLKSHGNRWAMALVEASYYSQKHFLINNSFHRSASIAKQIVKEYEQQH